MINRSMVRHTCFRMKAGQEPSANNKHIVELVQVPEGESWETFGARWDVIVDKKEKIHTIVPETNFDFILSTCAEAKMMFKYTGKVDFDDHRKQNIVNIVELSMLGDLMSWDNYNDTWGVELDRDLSRIYTKYFKTKLNIVTPEMISASRISDGDVMVKPAELEKINIDMVQSEPTEQEKKMLKAFSKKKIKGH